MTPAEAIEIIRGCLGNIIAPYSDEMDAFGMAIEALETVDKIPELIKNLEIEKSEYEEARDYGGISATMYAIDQLKRIMEDEEWK